MHGKIVYIIACCLAGWRTLPAQARPDSASWWHGEKRVLRYRPEGGDFMIVNGQRRFNRALYGSHTAFRVEAGDLPEFALYMPGMGGNLRFGLMWRDSSKWLIRASKIEARYRPGSMLYTLRDPALGEGALHITVLATANGEGLLVKMKGDHIPAGLQLFCAFGGASGKKFSRDGDIGADPESSFYLQPGYCKGDSFRVTKTRFRLYYGKGRTPSEDGRYEIRHLPQKENEAKEKIARRSLAGVFPPGAVLKLSNATEQSSPAAFWASTAGPAPALTALVPLSPGADLYFLIQNPAAGKPVSYAGLPALFQQAEAARQRLTGRVVLHTPDPYLNTLGGALTVAADAIWEPPSYLHGAVAWRMRLPAWRGPYAADPLGWHDRARLHFSSYALSQIISPAGGPVVADTALHLARQWEKLGTALFSSGYICRNPNGDIRPHHYDMNLVFIDALLDHFRWTGDTAYIRQIWPLLQRHLAWEKRNFDSDGDGLYDAYCCIWASDALEYSGGGVTHSTAYNYRANKMMAELAARIGKDPKPYREEAARILRALNAKLWLPAKGWYGEYKDRMGLQRVHPAAGLWTIYHAIDDGAADPFQAYQALRYIDKKIPHIPVRAEGLTDTGLYVLSTTNWQPYTWSVNNVAMAEELHTALAYWEGNRPETACRLWKAALMESMYLGASPGNFQQLSFYDAMRGELYRDFADPIGIAARSLVEGLFGILPDALRDTLTVRPGWPAAWDSASLKIPDITLDFTRTGSRDRYSIKPSFPKKMAIRLCLRARSDAIASLTINGRTAHSYRIMDAVGAPMLEIRAGKAASWEIVVTWAGKPFEKPLLRPFYAVGDSFALRFQRARVLSGYDPQQCLQPMKNSSGTVRGILAGAAGDKTFFVQLKQGAFTWWQPECLDLRRPIGITATPGLTGKEIRFCVRNNTASAMLARCQAGSGPPVDLSLAAAGTSKPVLLKGKGLVCGTNSVKITWNYNRSFAGSVIDWDLPNAPGSRYDTIDLHRYFNDAVTNIFRDQYLSPRPASPTLQLPTQGIGNWCYPLAEANIDDSGLRKKAGDSNEIVLPAGIPFATPSKAKHNIIFTSRWDRYPDSVVIPLPGKAAHAYFLMAGSTNSMQSRFTNGVLRVQYKDGTRDSLDLKNPGTWWPIEQDYYVDGFAFTIDHPKPPRLYLKSGEIGDHFRDYRTIKGFTNRAVDGGAATVLDLPLDPQKELDKLVLETTANEVVIGLMSLTLMR